VSGTLGRGYKGTYDVGVGHGWMKGNSSTREESENAQSIYKLGNPGISAMRTVLVEMMKL
jgi:hypothetical protein